MAPRLARHRRARRSAVPVAAEQAVSPTPAGVTPPSMPDRSLVPRPVEEPGEATRILFARLTGDDVAAVEAQLRDEHRGIWEYASEDQRQRLALGLGLAYGIETIAEHTGLRPVMPPNEVHSMAHGWITDTGGSYYLADMVFEGLAASGDPLAAGAHALDFSCSSGRVVRPLAAARDDVHWHGCDPNAEAIRWAAGAVPGIDFFLTPPAPPLHFDAGHFDLIFAISVWSHYNAVAALRWIEECHRLLRPGGKLLFTTHGLQACVFFTQVPDPAIEAKLGPDWITRTRDRLERDGHCFWNVFGEDGDWGVVDPEWGLAFFTPEWLLEHVTPAWSLRSYRVGRAYANQDVYLLERR